MSSMRSLTFRAPGFSRRSKRIAFCWYRSIQAAGGGHQHVGAAAQPLHLRVEVDHRRTPTSLGADRGIGPLLPHAFGTWAASRGWGSSTRERTWIVAGMCHMPEGRSSTQGKTQAVLPCLVLERRPYIMTAEHGGNRAEPESARGGEKKKKPLLGGDGESPLKTAVQRGPRLKNRRRRGVGRNGSGSFPGAGGSEQKSGKVLAELLLRGQETELHVLRAPSRRCLATAMNPPSTTGAAFQAEPERRAQLAPSSAAPGRRSRLASWTSRTPDSGPQRISAGNQASHPTSDGRGCR